MNFKPFYINAPLEKLRVVGSGGNLVENSVENLVFRSELIYIEKVDGWFDHNGNCSCGCGLKLVVECEYPYRRIKTYP